jgi:hypothetical protein
LVSATVAVLRKDGVAAGYKHELSAAALVLGPAGLAWDDANDVLYVASANDNATLPSPVPLSRRKPEIKGKLVFADPRLRGPLSLAFVPTGHLVTANSDAVNGDRTHPSEIWSSSGQARSSASSTSTPGRVVPLASVLRLRPMIASTSRRSTTMPRIFPSICPGTGDVFAAERE